MAIPAPRIDGRPTCPQGHSGRVIAFGRQVRADEAYSRPRFRCFPSDGSAEHTFMPARRQPTHGHPHGAVCVHCERDYGPADGARTGPRYSQSVIEIGSLLASVARGDSLRVASRDARKAARRLSFGPFREDGSPRTRQAYNSRQNVLAARYLDAYGPTAVSELLPRAPALASQIAPNAASQKRSSSTLSPAKGAKTNRQIPRALVIAAGISQSPRPGSELSVSLTLDK